MFCVVNLKIYGQNTTIVGKNSTIVKNSTKNLAIHGRFGFSSQIWIFVSTIAIDTFDHQMLGKLICWANGFVGQIELLGKLKPGQIETWSNRNVGKNGCGQIGCGQIE